MRDDLRTFFLSMLTLVKPWAQCARTLCATFLFRVRGLHTGCFWKLLVWGARPGGWTLSVAATSQPGARRQSPGGCSIGRNAMRRNCRVATDGSTGAGHASERLFVGGSRPKCAVLAFPTMERWAAILKKRAAQGVRNVISWRRCPRRANGSDGFSYSLLHATDEKELRSVLRQLLDA